MGPTQSSDARNDSEINRLMNKNKKTEKTTYKLLLLGAGESGKTTIFKQMKLANGNTFDKETLTTSKCHLFSNLIQGTLGLIAGCRDLGTPIDEPELERAVEIIRKTAEMGKKDKKVSQNDSFTLPQNFMLMPPVQEALLKLWDCDKVQANFQRCMQNGAYNVPDSFAQVMERLRDYPAWGGEGWLPSNEDCLLVRQRTTGMASDSFYNSGSKFSLIDVGGQRSERKKWIHAFENVTAVLFVSSMSEYDQTLWEESNVNRLEDSIDLFKKHACLEEFKRSALIVFFNKKDLFHRKYMELHIPINESGLFPDAPKAEDEKDEHVGLAKNWFKAKFNSVLPPDRTAFMHFTCALDKNQLKHVIDSCAEHILQESLIYSGFPMK